ncbi:polysaccharide deacetylase, PdaB family [Cladochytrium replicatum]|nr:polysaccharide deacetylase, PdaB family [Cladochytrium replicatum]
MSMATDCVDENVNVVDLKESPFADTLALTFDDGPIRSITPHILDALAETGVKATFFVMGNSVQDAPELLKRAYDEGHQIGNHTYTHPFLTKLTPEELDAEITRTEDLIHSVIGVRTASFRPPYIDSDKGLQATLHQKGYHLVGACLNTEDYAEKDPFEAFERELLPGKGYISLQHDNQPVETAEKIKQIIKLARSRGFRFVSVAECSGTWLYMSLVFGR